MPRSVYDELKQTLIRDFQLEMTRKRKKEGKTRGENKEGGIPCTRTCRAEGKAQWKKHPQARTSRRLRRVDCY